jgi:subtilisin family serine protease
MKRLAWNPFHAAIAALSIATLALLSPTALAANELLPGWQKHEMRVSGKVDDPLVAALEKQERIRVIVMLDVRAQNGRSLQRFSSSAARRALRAEGDRVLSRLPEGRFELTYQYGSLNAMAGETDAEGVMALMAQPEVTGIGMDERQAWSLAEAIPVSGVRAVQGMANHGKGEWVAVLDSGIDTNHRDLKKPLKQQECFCSPGCCPNGSSRQSGKGSAEDDVGHGTLVSSVVVSRGKVAPRGAARNAKLLHVKVGSFQGPMTSDSLAALDFIAQEKPEVRALNMSFGTINTYKGNCDKRGTSNRARSAAINALRDLGVMTFAASGNDASSKAMSSPACIKKAISVGAVWDADEGGWEFSRCVDPTSSPNQLACFSNRSKTTDIFAPGAFTTGSNFNGGVTTSVGTSFSSPLATGCAVLLRKKYPNATVDEVEAAMKASGTRVFDSVSGRQYPALDCHDAADRLGG